MEVISIANLWVYLGFDQCCFLGRESDISQVTLLVVPGHRGLSSPGWDSWESTGSSLKGTISKVSDYVKMAHNDLPMGLKHSHHHLSI